MSEYDLDFSLKEKQKRKCISGFVHLQHLYNLLMQKTAMPRPQNTI